MMRLSVTHVIGFCSLVAGCTVAKPLGVNPSESLVRVTEEWESTGKVLAERLLNNKAAWGKLPPVPSVAVLPLSSESRSTTQLGIVIADGVEQSLLDANRMRLVERRAIAQVLCEQDLCLALSNSEVPAVGGALSADALLTGNLTVVNNCIVAEVRLINVKTGEVLARADITNAMNPDTQFLLTYVQRPCDKSKAARELPPLTLYYDVLAQRPNTPTAFGDVIVREGTHLHSGDQYRIRFHTTSDCYLYVLTYDSRKDVYVLFPRNEIQQGNCIRGGYDYTIPGENEPWYTLDDTPGPETLVFVASYEPLKDLETLLVSLKNAGTCSGDTQASVQQEVSRLSRTRGGENYCIDGYRISRIRGTVLSPPKASYLLNDGRSIENVMRVAQGTDRVVQSLTFLHDR